MNDEKVQAIDHLAAMRMLTEWTGQVSENQLKTLNLWPAVMVPGTKSHRVAVNLDEHKVVFHLTMKPGKTIKDLTALTRIESGVWALLGDTWYTIVRAGKKVVYSGTRRKEFQFDTNSSGPRQGPDTEGEGGVRKVRRGRKATSRR
jgi:hypothetical protein